MKSLKFRDGIPGAVIVALVLVAGAWNAHYAHRRQQLQERVAASGRLNGVHVKAWHADGTVFFEATNHNLRTNAGADAQASQMGNTATQAAACNYIALSNDTTAPGSTDTSVTGEITTNGLARAQGTYSHTNGTTSFTVVKTFTATGSQSAQKTGLLNAPSAGTLCFENTFSQVSLAANDTLQVTWTVNY